MRKRLICPNGNGGGNFGFVEIQYKSEYPLGGEDSAWDTDYYYEKLKYKISDQNFNVLVNSFGAGEYIRFSVNNGDSIYIEPVNKDSIPNDLIIYRGSIMYLFFYDKNGDGIVNSPVGYVRWTNRPGGYSVSVEVGNHAVYSDFYINQNIPSHLERDILILNASVTIADDFNISFYLYS